MNNYLKLLICLTITSFAIYAISSSTAYGFEQFSIHDLPYGQPYDNWVAKYWNWDLSIPTDPSTGRFAGLSDNGCLIHEEDSVIMLVDTAAGGIINQVCEISADRGILFPIWTGECSRADIGYENASFEELSKCARDFDLGKVSGLVKIDNIPVAKLDVVDYTTSNIENVTEINTGLFNLTLPLDTHGVAPKTGTFPAAAHGWFVFLKPLPLGEHTIYYKNSVEPTTLSGAENRNTAEITYHINIK